MTYRILFWVVLGLLVLTPLAVFALDFLLLMLAIVTPSVALYWLGVAIVYVHLWAGDKDEERKFNKTYRSSDVDSFS
ncbi:MAG: hypothetical protein ACRC5T_10705 [Cetobacterium sp.]